jgi:hypothetical protein
MGNYTDGGLLPEDDPIYSEPWTIFVPRQMRPAESGQPKRSGGREPTRVPAGVEAAR